MWTQLDVRKTVHPSKCGIAPCDGHVNQDHTRHRYLLLPLLSQSCSTGSVEDRVPHQTTCFFLHLYRLSSFFRVSCHKSFFGSVIICVVSTGSLKTTYYKKPVRDMSTSWTPGQILEVRFPPQGRVSRVVVFCTTVFAVGSPISVPTNNVFP